MMTEIMLADTARAHDLRYVARYFNVAGADPRGRSGQSTPRRTSSRSPARRRWANAATWTCSAAIT